ncbi:MULTISPECIES: YitT family protein [unclassified Marinitoga]|uniref:YitT family protein n=1 Tax=unclassified Marinitoga TaxID=2640159 RepID=UPI0012E0340F|nr:MULTISPECIES: YitT family protein [unclassified Marinitoga]
MKIEMIKELLLITIGTFINAIGWTLFLIPWKIVGGGLSGVGTMIYYITGIPVGISYLLMNIVLLYIAMKIIGKSFGFKTTYGILSSSLFITILQNYFHSPIIYDQFLSTVIGGILLGSGVGIVFLAGGTTGGTEIIVMIINKFRNISPGRTMFLFDIIIIGSSIFIFGSFEKIIYGYVTMAIAGYATDLVLEGKKSSVQLFIFSEFYGYIADEITETLGRGVTVIQGTGWYTKENKNIILTIIKRKELPIVLKIIKKYDKNAFISMSSAAGVFGQGFEQLRI